MHLNSNRTYNAADLAKWKQHIYDGSAIQLPMRAARTNPVVLGKAVFIVIFSQGRILAFHRESGKPLWKTNLGCYGGSHLDVVDGMLFAGTSQSLNCIDPLDGRIVWSYAPYGATGEHFYSSPAYGDAGIIVGDNKGWIHCVSRATGEPLWRVKPSTAVRCRVNATACVLGEIVVICTISGLAAAYDITTGKQRWRAKLSCGASYELAAYGGDVLIPGATAIFQIDVSDGDLKHTWQYKDRGIGGLEIAGSRAFTVLKDLGAEKLLESRKRGTGSYYNKISLIKYVESLAFLLPDRVEWNLGYPRYYMAHLKWNAITGLLYEATNGGIGIVDVDAGERISKIVDAHEYDMHVGFSQPAVEGDRLFAMTEKGDLYCLRHP